MKSFFQIYATTYELVFLGMIFHKEPSTNSFQLYEQDHKIIKKKEPNI